MLRFPGDQKRLDALAAAELTYADPGATRGGLPPGYRHARRDAALGFGRAVFERAVDGLLTWEMHRRAGMAVTASEPNAVPGAIVVLRLGIPPLGFLIPCRVVYRVEEPDRRGFAYGTLPGHPVRGEELFVVRLQPDGEVRFGIAAFSRPASLAARLGGPAGRKVQAVFTDRYVRAMQRIAEGSAVTTRAP
ncbi:DUF1990 family protein [Micromonospora avicenniae]|uniref:Uncharacterized protein, UPF0548 family n=1 Tax=Micromonospora avicenniae TaxID=1198245 RepID=A0A1N6Y298_9ACTN|nr:DUF1990 domain-containing protein [Micromonospora avicenniae]SIR08654.1 Uncharacterized protein, UPF0548 family [Micromonospora avicenniae]